MACIRDIDCLIRAKVLSSAVADLRGEQHPIVNQYCLRLSTV